MMNQVNAARYVGMPNWIEHLTPTERRQLESIERRLVELNTKRRKLMNRATVRKHRAK